MKTILAIAMLIGVSAKAGVSVTIDGTTYSCTQGGSANLCECVVREQSSGYWSYTMFMRGKVVKSVQYISSKKLAEKQCSDETIQTPACY